MKNSLILTLIFSASVVLAQDKTYTAKLMSQSGNDEIKITLEGFDFEDEIKEILFPADSKKCPVSCSSRPSDHGSAYMCFMPGKEAVSSRTGAYYRETQDIEHQTLVLSLRPSHGVQGDKLAAFFKQKEKSDPKGAMGCKINGEDAFTIGFGEPSSGGEGVYTGTWSWVDQE